MIEDACWGDARDDKVLVTGQKLNSLWREGKGAWFQLNHATKQLNFKTPRSRRVDPRFTIMRAFNKVFLPCFENLGTENRQFRFDSWKFGIYFVSGRVDCCDV